MNVKAIMFAGGGLMLSMVLTTVWISSDIERIKEREAARDRAACAQTAATTGTVPPADPTAPAATAAAPGAAAATACPKPAAVEQSYDPATSAPLDPSTQSTVDPSAGQQAILPDPQTGAAAPEAYADSAATDPYGADTEPPQTYERQ